MYQSKRIYSLNLNGRLCQLDATLVMGIVNVTPDSFYADSRVEAGEALLAKIAQHVQEGASIIDVGACSTRPGSEAVSAQEEMQRLRPALELIRRHYPDLILSVDTFRAEVARMAVEEFAVAIINDVSGGDADADMFRTVADCCVPYVLTHSASCYKQASHESIEGMIRDLAVKLAELRALGVADVLIDPGFGFGKSLEDNYRLLHRLADFRVLDAPILVGVSRKSMAYKLLDIKPEDALNATTVLHTLALQSGVEILRVHDVKAAVECVKLVDFYQSVI